MWSIGLCSTSVDYEDQRQESLTLAMSDSASKELDSIATCFVSMKRPRSCGTDDDEDAGLLRRKRAIAATSKQPDEEPQVTPKTRSLTYSSKGTD